MKYLFVSRNLYHFQSTICDLHKLFINIIQLPLTFLNIQASSFIPDENKLFWQFHHNKNSNSIMLASVHHWISEACTILASFESTKHSGRITYTSFVIFSCRNFVLTFILPYPIKRYVVIASITRTD